MKRDVAGRTQLLSGIGGSPAPNVQTGVEMPRLFTIGAITAVLYVGRDVLIPVAVATLLTFTIAPIVSFLRRRGLPRIAAVLATVLGAFAAIAIFLMVVGSQFVTLAENIPTYQYNIIAKVRSLKDAGASGGVIDRITQVVERVGDEISKPESVSPTPAVEAETKPVPVEVVTSPGPIELVNTIIVPLISPFATAALVIVVVIFMLLEREHLRDRFIRLAGYSDLHRTTEALQDAGRRVGKYLLMQLLVNTLYAFPSAIGLWLLGIPNPALWGMLALVLRFIPYVGPIIAMALPILVTFAVTPGWTAILWVIGLFLVVELITNNILEPWLYGSRTGLSPLAIIVAAIFWSWLWGPIGLVMSTPLTVCLVVLGRYVPQFEFLSVAFGDEPVLEPHARLYQRLLANDPEEGAEHAEEFLEDAELADFYDEVGVPALLLAEADLRRGAMSPERINMVASAALELVDDLTGFAEEEEEEDDSDPGEATESVVAGRTTRAPRDPLPYGEGRNLLCSGGRWPIDDAAAAMMSQVLDIQGAETRLTTHSQLDPANIRKLDLAGIDTVILTYVNPSTLNHARYAVQRLKRAREGLRVGLLLPNLDEKTIADAVTKRTNADFAAATIRDTARQALGELTPARPAVKRKLTRRTPKRKVKSAEAA
jgi:predicted PurR-regulated permease PerM